MAFRIVFFCDPTINQVIPKPILGRVVFDNFNSPKAWRSRSMEEPSLERSRGENSPSVPLSRSMEGTSTNTNQNPDEESVMFFAGNPEVEVTKGVLRLFKDNKIDSCGSNRLPTKRSDLVCLLAVPASYR